MMVAPALPALGALREGPGMLEAKMPLGWRRAASSMRSTSYSNGLSGAFRSSASLVQAPLCSARGCACDKLVRNAIDDDVWRVADVGRMKRVQLGEPSPVRSETGMMRVDGLIDGEDGQKQVSAICTMRDIVPVALVVLQPQGGSSSLVERMAVTLTWPGRH
jgi:hypothetical protein